MSEKRQTPGRPNTQAELDALPEDSSWDMSNVGAVFHDDDDIIEWLCADGHLWRIGRYLDGRWYKRRVL